MAFLLFIFAPRYIMVLCKKTTTFTNNNLFRFRSSRYFPDNVEKGLGEVSGNLRVV